MKLFNNLKKKLPKKEKELIHNISNNLMSLIKKSLDNKDKYDIIWEVVNHLDNFSKSVFKFKYSYKFDHHYTNKELASIFGCSEEKIRINVKKTQLIIIKTLREIYLFNKERGFTY